MVFVHQFFPKDWFDHSGIMIRFNWVTVAQKIIEVLYFGSENIATGI